MSIEYKNAAAAEGALWPETLDPYKAEYPQLGRETALVFLRDGRLLLSCDDPYYNGGFSKESAKQLIRLCATFLLQDEALGTNYVSFEGGFLTVRDNSLLGVSVNDDYYNGEVSPEDAFKLALMILRAGNNKGGK